MSRTRVAMKWHGPAVIASVRAEMNKRLAHAGEFLRSRIAEGLSLPSRPPGRPSLPGEKPHADTGKLRQSIFYDVDKSKLTCIVGTPLKYGAYLELGTSRMEPRVYLLRTFAANHSRLKAIMAAPGRFRGSR
jgi:hypothetical protein